MRVLFNEILLKMTGNDESSHTCQSFIINVKGKGGGGGSWRLKSQNQLFCNRFSFETKGRREIEVYIF